MEHRALGEGCKAKAKNMMQDAGFRMQDKRGWHRAKIIIKDE